MFTGEEVNEDFPFAAAGAIIPEGMSMAEADAKMATAAATESMVDKPMDGDMATANALKQGEFTDSDRLHQGSGAATIYQLPDGSHVVRLENLDVTNGPDLRVLLAGHEDPRSRDALNESGYIELDRLKGNLGNQNYPIPADVDISEFKSVVIYCEPFHVVFSTAPLS